MKINDYVINVANDFDEITNRRNELREIYSTAQYLEFLRNFVWFSNMIEFKLVLGSYDLLYDITNLLMPVSKAV